MLWGSFPADLTVIESEENNEKCTKKSQDDEDEDAESVNNNKTKSIYSGTHKKKLHPLLLGPGRRDPRKYVPLHTASKNNLSEFTQRIMSAKLLRVKQVQNQLSETQIQLNELMNENRILKNLQKRQEGALKKYEGNHAELPQLIRSHNEEIRTLKASNKLMKVQLKESNSKLKERENELESLKDNYNKLKKLCHEKNLFEREKLQKKVDELQDVVKQQDEKIQLLSRKILLESKNYRHHLNIEINKHKETQKDLSNALGVISRLENQLLMKDKVNWIPGGFGKPHKREPKNLMPTISNKSLEIQPGCGSAENILREGSSKCKNETSETPDTELELLNSLMSSDDTPSPTQDILPEIMALKKASPESITHTNVKLPKSSEVITDNSKRESFSMRKGMSSATKKPSKLSSSAEYNAKGITEKISESIESVDYLMQKDDLNAINSKVRLNSLYEELKTNVTKIGEELRNKTEDVRQDVDITVKNESFSGTSSSSGSLRRSVTKRKLEDERLNRKLTDEGDEANNELSPGNQQKFVNMAKTWNDIKERVQEERKKAEEKIKELDGFTGPSESPDVNSAFPDGWEEHKEASGEPAATVLISEKLSQKGRGNFKLVQFRSNDYIMNELEKTDKAFKRLKNEKIKDGRQFKSEGQISAQENVNYRTESHRQPKYLDEFQSEFQKQNLLKALKAIDLGKGGHSSSEEPEESPRDKTPISFASHDSKNDLINELFGSNSKKINRTDRIGVDCTVLDGIKAKNN